MSIPPLGKTGLPPPSDDSLPLVVLPGNLPVGIVSDSSEQREALVFNGGNSTTDEGSYFHEVFPQHSCSEEEPNHLARGSEFPLRVNEDPRSTWKLVSRKPRVKRHIRQPFIPDELVDGTLNEDLQEYYKDEHVPGGKRHNVKEVRNRFRKKKGPVDKPDPHGLCDDYFEDEFLAFEYNQAVIADKDAKEGPKKGPPNNKKRTPKHKQASKSPPPQRKSSPEDRPPVPIIPPLPPPNTEGGEARFVSERDHLIEAVTSSRKSDDSPGSDPVDQDAKLSRLLSSIASMKQMHLDGDSDIWVSHLENIVILGYQLGVARNFTDVFVAIAAYIKMNCKKSALSTIMALIDDIADPDAEPQAWTASTVIETWDLFTNHPMYAKISYLLSAAMSMSVCSIREIDWNPMGLKMVRIEAAKEQLKAYDVIDATIKTFVWFAQTGYEVFQTGSLSPFLHGDVEMTQFHADCDYVIAYADTALAGNIPDGLVEYERKVDRLLMKIAQLQKASSSGALNVWLQKRYADIVYIKQRLICKHKNTAIRFQPFGMALTGSSGVGKSTLNPIVMKCALHAMGFDHSPDRIATYDKEDAYDSTYTSDILGLSIDDMGNGKSEFEKKSPSNLIIKFFNNVAAQAVKAELNQKGVTFIDFKCGIVTSNLTDLGVREYSHKPESILRRMWHTRVKVKDKFRKVGSVSLNTNHPELDSGDLCQDIWDLTIQECHIYETGDREAYAFRTIRVELYGKSILCENLGLDLYIDVVVHLATMHAKAQVNLIARSLKLDNMAMCPTCKRPASRCKCPSAEYVPKCEACVKPKILCSCSPAQGFAVLNVGPGDLVGAKPEPHADEDLGDDTELPVPTTTLYVHPDGTATIEYLQQVVELDKNGNFSLVPRTQEDVQRDVLDVFDRWKNNLPEPHSFERLGDIVLTSSLRAVKNYLNSWFRPFDMLNTLLGFRPVSHMATRALASEFQSAIDHTATPWLIALTPKFVFQTRYYKSMVAAWQRTAAFYDVRNHLRAWSAGSLILIGGALYTREPQVILASSSLSWMGSMFLWGSYRSRLTHYEEAYCTRRDALPDYVKQVRDSNVTKGFMVAATFAVGLKFVSLWNEFRINAEQGAAPQSTINQDAQESWFGSMFRKLGVTVKTDEAMSTVTSEQAVATFQKNNLFWATIDRDDKIMQCNAFFPRKGVVLLPRHVFFPSSNLKSEPTRLIRVSISRTTDNAPGSCFEFLADYDCCVHSPNHDLVMIWVPNCPDLRDRTSFLPLNKPQGRSMCDFVVRKREGFVQEKVSVEHGTYQHSSSDPFYGGVYRSQNAVRGACMGLLIREGKNPCILGLHIAGKPAEGIGFMQTLIKSEFDTMYDKLNALPGVVPMAEGSDLPEKVYDKIVLTSELPHPNCLASKFDARHKVEVLGSTKLRMQSRSTVHPSVLSETVESVTGVPNTWGPPQMLPNWKAFNTSLEHMVDPSTMIDPSLLAKASLDYLAGLPLNNGDVLKPLSDSEAIMGVPGVRFVDALEMNTSMGFPVFGKKRPHFTEVFEGKKLVDRVPSPAIQQELDRMSDCWKRGIRAHPIFSSFLKDESTPVDKTKVRVVQAGPVAMTIKVRKYFLPVARWLALHPIESESAVGVNCVSRDWETLLAHATQHAADNAMLAWDYKKFDLSMSAQMTINAYWIMIAIAKACGYEDKDLIIMRAMIADLTHPDIDYNGVLLRLCSINVSGISLTVQINGIVGSLYVRCGYFSVYPADANFRAYCAALTYGDDFVGSVSPLRRKFNFRSFKNFLSTIGMVITPPSKTGEDFDFMSLEEIDFLKRKSNYVPEIGVSIGALDEMSIFKSLHSNLTSRTETPRQVAASCLESAMHEWFAHGREVYTLRQQQMMEVCRIVDLPVPAVSASFDERVAHWHSKYPVG